MLNRRILRAKAMQALYGYRQCKEANFHVTIERIGEKFLPDLNSMEKQDPVKLNEDKAATIALFKNHYDSNHAIKDMSITPRVRQVASDAIAFYHKQVRKDYEQTLDMMLRYTDKIYDRYLSLLQLLVELSDFVDKEFKERQKRLINPAPVFEHEQKFFINKTVGKLRNHRSFNKEVLNRKLYFDPELVRQWFKILQKDEIYIEYQRLTEATEEKDFEIVDYILRNIILKHDVVVSYFDDADLNWDEDKVTLKSMATKTLKAINELGTEADLVQLSPNWEEDRDFYKSLFNYVVTNDDEYTALISAKTQNWDINRITPVDVILLKMAMAEMTNFQTIPVKVSINEYIEICKVYGTPKSKEFINGLLEVLAKELESQGKIRKSGRGLIDNK
jgi:N utilization substance protein B